jgi:hypothetical protein
MTKVFTSLPEYQAYNARRAEAIKRNGEKTALNAAMFMAAKTRAYAPRKSGNLIKGIVRKKNIVTARASNKGFPYIHWVNQTPGTPYHTLELRRLRRTGRFTKKKTNVRYLAEGSPFLATYGLQPTEPSVWNYTGQAGFFQKAFKETRLHFSDSMQRMRKKSLVGEFI